MRVVAVRTGLLATAVLSVLAVAGCRRSGGPLPDASQPVLLDLSTNRVHIGDVVTLRAVVHHEPGIVITWPDPAQGAEVVVRSHLPAENLAPNVSAKSWEVTSLRVGTHRIFTNGVVLRGADGAIRELPMPDRSIRVDSVLGGTNVVLRDVKGLARWPRPGLQSVFLMLAAVAALAVLIALLVLALRRRGRTPPATVETPPHERALQAIQDLRAKRLIEQGEVEAFFIELSAIVRHYIEERFGMHAPEQTTEEFIRTATSSRLLSLDHQMLVTAFLEQCDLVKFARHRPGTPEMEAAIAAAERLVRETVPQQPVAAAPQPSMPPLPSPS